MSRGTHKRMNKPIKALMRTLFFLITIISTSGLLACSPLSPKETTPNQPTPHQNVLTTGQVTTVTTASQLTTETLYALLLAEMAASRQQYTLTLERYVEQANITNDPQVIARAARIAQFFKAQQESLDMGLMWLEHEPSNIEAIALVANAYIELGQPLMAVEHTATLLTLTQNSPDYDAGALLETTANFSKNATSDVQQQLIERYQELTITYPKLAGLNVGLSILYQHQGQHQQAIHWVNKALQVEPQRTSALIQEILLLQENQQEALAEEKLQEYLERDPTNNRLRLVYARLLTHTDVQKSYEQFTQLSEQSPQQLELQFSRALLAIELQKLEEGQTLLTQLYKQDYRPDLVPFYLGHIHDLLDDKETALSYYLTINSGNNVLAAQSRAARIMIELERYQEAHERFDVLRQQHNSEQEQLYVNESNALLRQQMYTKALHLLNEALSTYPDNSRLRYNRSTIYEKNDQLALMEQDLRHVLSIEPDNVSALNGLGYFLASRTERYQEALALIEKALTLRPKDAAIIDSMGWVLFKLGRIDEAIGYLEQAFTIFPDPEVAAHLGEALWTQGKTEQAKQIWQDSLQDHPQSSVILETLDRLGVSL